MLNRFKTALYNVVGSFDPGDGTLGGLASGSTAGLPTAAGTIRTGILPVNSKEKSLRFPYTRPHFLQLGSEDEIQVTADHSIRPIICPRDISRLPWNSGYAETINAGKSIKNEDQAVVHVGLLTRPVKLDASTSQGPRHKGTAGHAEPLVNGHSEDQAKPDQPKPNQPKLDQPKPDQSKPDQPNADQPKLDQPKPDQSKPDVQTVVLEPRGTTSAATELKEDHYQDPSVDHSDSVHNHNAEALPSDRAESPPSQPQTASVSVPYYVFGVFDGHAGWGAAVAAANQLHHIIHDKLCDVIDILIPDPSEDGSNKVQSPLWAPEREVTVESAVTGALENAFWQMDHVIGEDRLRFQLHGGCTACVALLIHGKLFLANAGDSRGIISLNSQPHPMSYDFTPETESQRIRKLGAMHPELLGDNFTHLDFMRRPMRRDLGKRVLYRDHYMNGWAYKTLTPDDLKYPLVCGEGKRSRVLATIGVTRGFGDHDLTAQCTSIPIKPFLTPEPEVRIFDLSSTEVTDSDVLILATDGLWDITSNEKAVEVVVKSLTHFPPDDRDKHKYRYTSAAQDLVMGSRGKLRERNWRTSDDKHATIDDISVFVVPLKPYKEEHRAWTLRHRASLGGSVQVNNGCDGVAEVKCDVAVDSLLVEASCEAAASTEVAQCAGEVSALHSEEVSAEEGVSQRGDAENSSTRDPEWQTLVGGCAQ